MAMGNPYLQYQKQSVTTASPGELTLMLYNGCIKFIKKASAAGQDKNIPQMHENIIKAQNIITEFMSTLDMEYDVSKSLMVLYDYMRRRLIEANLKKDQEILEEVLGLVTELRDTWEEVVRLNRLQSYGAGRS
ncbi:MAG: flagellar export chaperone FliS [Clostridia bacterium]|jgi:flagellar protein FliS